MLTSLSRLLPVVLDSIRRGASASLQRPVVFEMPVARPELAPGHTGTPPPPLPAAAAAFLQKGRSLPLQPQHWVMSEAMNVAYEHSCTWMQGLFIHTATQRQGRERAACALPHASPVQCIEWQRSELSIAHLYQTKTRKHALKPVRQ